MKIKRLEHVAIAVKDLDATRRVLEETLGLTMEYQEEIPKNGSRLAMFPIGETSIELVQSTREGTRTQQWIAEKGEGLYHICLEVEDIEAALAELKAKGVALLDGTPRTGHGGHHIAFLDPRATANVLVELVEIRAGHGAEASAG
jgi:methylmalonyl-CoA/ethylmalonyl-CoA epimerase